MAHKWRLVRVGAEAEESPEAELLCEMRERPPPAARVVAAWEAANAPSTPT